MEANAKTIPMPPNIKELDELAKIYNKPNPAAQAKILEDAAKATTKQLEFDEALKKAQAKLADAKAFAKKKRSRRRRRTKPEQRRKCRKRRRTSRSSSISTWMKVTSARQ
jgi:hypothetical protein